MLIIFIRAFILFAVLLLVVRMMGKRQVGEMEPFELVITLIIADITCIPVADRSIPITFGIVGILTMFIIHQLIVLLSKNSTLQAVLSGKPVMVIDRQGVNAYALRRMNMQMSDLLQAIRAAGYFSVEEIDYGLMETNGQLSVVPNRQFADAPKTLPVPLVLDSKWSEEDMARYRVDKATIEGILHKLDIKLKNIMLLTVDTQNHIVIQQKHKKLSSHDYSGAKLLDEQAPARADERGDKDE